MYFVKCPRSRSNCYEYTTLYENCVVHPKRYGQTCPPVLASSIDIMYGCICTFRARNAINAYTSWTLHARGNRMSIDALRFLCILCFRSISFASYARFISSANASANDEIVIYIRAEVSSILRYEWDLSFHRRVVLAIQVEHQRNVWRSHFKCPAMYLQITHWCNITCTSIHCKTLLIITTHAWFFGWLCTMQVT